MAGSHTSLVRSLYKRILLLHRMLPLDLKAIGDEYVKAEFQRHKTAKPEEVGQFISEWQNYAEILRDQTQQSGASKLEVGHDLTEDSLEDLSHDQIGQLYELRKETAKPSPFVPPEGPT